MLYSLMASAAPSKYFSQTYFNSSSRFGERSKKKPRQAPTEAHFPRRTSRGNLHFFCKAFEGRINGGGVVKPCDQVEKSEEYVNAQGSAVNTD